MDGFVYRDLNNNGLKEAGETGISGVRVDLTGTDDYGNAVSANVNTDGTGAFSFIDLSSSTAGLGGATPLPRRTLPLTMMAKRRPELPVVRRPIRV